MGIRGLMSYVEDHSNQFFVDLKLRDTKIIIDGYALFHRLCFDSNVDLRHGGDYDSFTDVTQRFFESLFACKVHPYVVLDGGCDVSDKKFLTLKDRAREKIQVAHSLSVGGRGNLLPLLIREVFIQVLNKLHVDFVQCFSEADRDIMTLANHWNCPVLTMDSDFCIFDLKAGFCPLNGFQWKNLTVIKDTLHCYIPARCFSVDKFCSHFNNMNKTLLPLFAVLCGNDYISLPALDTVLNRMSFTPGTSNMKGRKHQRILGLLNWLSNFDDPPEALNTFVKYLNGYSWLWRKGNFLLSFAMLCRYGGLFFIHRWRTCGIQVPTSSLCPFGKSSMGFFRIFLQIHAVRLSEEYRELGRLTELSLSKRKILLLETLKVKEGILDPIPASLKLPIAVTCFWLQSLEAKVKRYHVQALLMGMLCGQLHKMTSEPDNEGLHVDGAKLLCDQFLKVKENKLQRKLNLDTAHVFCQWQCCLQMGFYLNQLLLTPLPEPDLTWLYSGTLVHGLSQELSTSSSAESILSVCPRARQLYNQLFHALKSAVPSECLSQREKLKAKKKKQRKNDASQTKYRVGVSLGTRSLCDHVSNSFGLLTVDDSED